MSVDEKKEGFGQDPSCSNLDRGWSWVILAASFGSCMLIGGTMYAVGIIHIALLDRFKQDVATTAWVGAIHSALMSVGGPMSTALIDRFSCRTALVTSGCLYTVGYLATAFAPNIEVCIFTCGIVAGCGGAAGYTAAIVVIGFNFRRKLNPAMGLSLSGIGAGMFVMSPVFEAARDFYGNSGFFIALAGLTINNIVFGTLCFPSKLELHTQMKRRRQIERKTQKGHSNLYSSLRFYLHVALEKPVLCLSFCLFNYGLGTFLIFLHLPNYAVHKGLTSIQGSLLVSISGAMGIIGRILTGFAANHEKIDDILLYAGSMGVVSLATFLFPLYSLSFPGQAFYSAILGLYFGCCYVLTGSVNIKFVGVKSMSAAIGIEFFFCGLGALVGPVLAGWMVDNGGTYDQGLVVAGFFLLVATILGIATVFVATPQDKEFEIPDREIEVLEKRNDSSGFLEEKSETSHESPRVSDKDDATSVLQLEPLIGAKCYEEEGFTGRISTDTCDIEVAPQAAQSETDMNNER